MLILLFLNTIEANAEESIQRSAVIKAKTSVAAFNCFALNDYLGRSEESKRLFNLGYSTSIEFYKSMEHMQLDSKTINEEIPSIFLMVGGPTPDFKAGQVFSSVVENTINSIYKDSQHNFEYDEPLRARKAEDLLHENNCSLIR